MIYQIIEIHGNTIVKKNSQQIAKYGGRQHIRPSNAYAKYQNKALYETKLLYKPVKLHYPVYLHYFFYRATKHKFDIGNLSEGPQDILTKCGLIEDDSMVHVIPVFHGKYGGWAIDKKNPRVKITITDIDF